MISFFFANPPLFITIFLMTTTILTWAMASPLRVALVCVSTHIAVLLALSIYLDLIVSWVLMNLLFLCGVLTWRTYVNGSALHACSDLFHFIFASFARSCYFQTVFFMSGYYIPYQAIAHLLSAHFVFMANLLPYFLITVYVVWKYTNAIPPLVGRLRVLRPFAFVLRLSLVVGITFGYCLYWRYISHTNLCHLVDFHFRLMSLCSFMYLVYHFFRDHAIHLPRLCFEKSRGRCSFRVDQFVFYFFVVSILSIIAFGTALISIGSLCDVAETQGKFKRYERRKRLPRKEEDISFIDNVQFLEQLLRDIRGGSVDREQHRTIIRRNFTRDEIVAAARDPLDHAQLAGYLRLAASEGRSVGRQAYVDGAGRYDDLILNGELSRARLIYNTGAAPSTVNLSPYRYRRLLKVLEHHFNGIPDSQGFGSMVNSITDGINNFVNGVRSIQMFGSFTKFGITPLTIITAILALGADVVALRHLYKTDGPWRTYVALRIAALCAGTMLDHAKVSAQVVSVFNETLSSPLKSSPLASGMKLADRVDMIYQDLNNAIVNDVHTFFQMNTTVSAVEFTDDVEDCLSVIKQLRSGASLRALRCSPLNPRAPRFMGTHLPQHYFHSEELVRRVLAHMTPISLVTQFAIHQMLPVECISAFILRYDENHEFDLITNGKVRFAVRRSSNDQYTHAVQFRVDENARSFETGYSAFAVVGDWFSIPTSQNGPYLPTELVQLLAHALFGVGDVAINTDRALRISKIASAFNTSVTLGKNIRDLFQVAFEVAYEKIFGHPYYGDLTEEQRTLTYSLSANMQVLVDSSFTPTGMTLETAEKVLALSPQVEEHLRNLAIASPSRIAFAPFGMIVSQFRPLVSKAQGFKNSLGDRRKTIGVAFSGAPGCGKTEVVPLIHQIVMKMIGEKDHLNRLIPRPEGAYMNGYLPPQHLGMLYDDFFQLKDEETNVQHVSEFIYLLTNKPYLPNYADVTSKGLNPFVALVLYMTTNNMDLGVSKPGFPARDKNAFFRRWFVFEVRNEHPNYNKKTGRFSPSVEFTTKYMRFDLVLLSWDNGKVKRDVVCADLGVLDVARFVAGKIKLEKQRFESKRAAVDTDALIANLSSDSISGVPGLAPDPDIEYAEKISVAHSQGIWEWIRGYDWENRWEFDAIGDLFPYGPVLRHLFRTPSSFVRSGASAPYSINDIDFPTLKAAVHAKYRVPVVPTTMDYLSLANTAYHEEKSPMPIFEVADKAALGVRNNFKFIGLALIAALGIGVGAYLALRKKAPEAPSESNAAGNYEKGVPKIPQRKLPPKAALKPEPMAVSQVSDANARDLINKLPAQYAYFTMHLCDAEGMVEATTSGWGLCVYGNQFIMPAHYFGDFPSDRIVVEMIWRGATYILEPNQFEVRPWPERDILTMRCKGVQFGSDIRHLFIKETQMDHRLVGAMFRALPTSPTSPTMVVESSNGASVYLTDVKSSINRVTKTISSCKRYLSLAMSNANGFCGALLMLDNRHSGEKMCGFHFAGSDNLSFFAIINQSDFDQYLFPVEQVVSQCAPYDYVTNQDIVISTDPSPDDRFLPKFAYRIGILPQFYNNHIARDTKIRRTHLDPDFVPRMSPAAMHPKLVNGVRVDPLLLAQAKSAVALMCFPADVRMFLRVAVSLIRRRFMETKVWPRGVLSFEESLNAPIDYNRLNPIRTDTSPGFAFAAHSTDAGKRSFCKISDDGIVVPIGNALRDSYDATMARLADGISIPVLYRVAQKDELRLNSRVEALSTRTVKGGPVNIVLAEKALFGCVVEWACQNFMLARQTFMINTMGGPMWSYMYRLAINRRVIVADIKNNDNEFQRELRSAECELRNFVADKCTTGLAPEQAIRISRQRATLNESLKNPFEVVGLLLYVRSLSLSSGSWLTTLSNGFGNDIALTAIFLRIVAREDPALFNAFLNGTQNMDDYFIHFHNGDDLIIFVTGCEYVTYESLEKEGHSFGRTFQKPDKGLSNVEFDGTISTADYLSRGFVERDGCVFAPLRAEKIESIPYWRWDNVIPDNIMQPELCEAALREWFQHGLDVFTEKKRYYDENLVRLGYRQTQLSYAKCLSDWSGQH